MDPVLRVTNLTKVFDGVRAVDGISFEVARGEIVGVLGPNGAGKTTTIAMILGLLTPTAGTIQVLGMSMPRERQRILARVNFSSPYVAMPYNLTVLENLFVFAHLYEVDTPAQKIRELLELFHLSGLAHQLTGRLSSGEATRLGLVKALLNDPEILFLDEPTASLDPEVAARVRDTLRRIQRERGITMVFTSHNMREVEVLCDRVLFLSRGRAVVEGTPEEVRARARARSLEDAFIVIARDGRLHDVAEVVEAD